MKLTIKTAALKRVAEALSDVQRLKPLLAIYGHVRVVVDKGSLTADVTDGVAWAWSSVDVAHAGDGAFCVSAKDFIGWARDSHSIAHEATIALETTDAGQRVKATCGRSRRVFPVLASLDDMPPRPRAGDAHTETSGPELARALASTRPVMSTDRTRGYLQQVVVREGYADATDSHRAHRALCSAEGLAVQYDVALAVEKFAASRDVVRVSTTRSHVFVADERGGLTWPVSDFLLPNFDGRFPQMADAHARVVVSREDAIESVRRMIAVDATTMSLDVESGGLRFRARPRDRADEAVDELTAEITVGEVATETIFVNPRYLLDALEQDDDESVTIGVSGPLDPLLVDSPRTWACISVMRP